ncbi:hypothetical protein LT493_00400 [Streptomyces tricolor]|nr:hypothetical protein [Streptomyces tricolor]
MTSCDPEYWLRNVRQTVRFADAVAAVRAAGADALVEVGPDATLAPLAEGGVPLLRRGRPEAVALVEGWPGPRRPSTGRSSSALPGRGRPTCPRTRSSTAGSGPPWRVPRPTRPLAGGTGCGGNRSPPPWTRYRPAAGPSPYRQDGRTNPWRGHACAGSPSAACGPSTSRWRARPTAPASPSRWRRRGPVDGVLSLLAAGPGRRGRHAVLAQALGDAGIDAPRRGA